MEHEAMEVRAGSARVAFVATAAVLLVAVGSLIWYFNRDEPLRSEPRGPEPAADGGIEALRPAVTAFCGDCHAVPSPLGYPKTAWSDEVRNGYRFYSDSGRSDLVVPEVTEVIAWYRSQAPAEIVVEPEPEAPHPSPVGFTSFAQKEHDPGAAPPSVAFIKWCRIADNEPPGWLYCDMLSGEIRMARHSEQGVLESRGIARLSHPAHVVPVDLDGDGLLDLLVAELGSFQPADHDRGQVMWLRRARDGAWEPKILLEGLGRVADVEPGDFNSDGLLDLVVAEFGWRSTGRILLLTQPPSTQNGPAFEMRVLDDRHGTIHVPPVDLDGDGRLDFVALISQEHETIDAFLNDGGGGFDRRLIFAAGEPAFGSSGIELVDLDGDGDLDLLYTNGDNFDSSYLKPFDGVHWLENTGGYPYVLHTLAKMPGAYRALPGDIDGDGDLDIAACALLRPQLHGNPPMENFAALIWLEQVSRGRFVKHIVRRLGIRFASLEVADADGDGDLDMAAGGFHSGEDVPPLTVWLNQRVANPPSTDRD